MNRRTVSSLPPPPPTETTDSFLEPCTSCHCVALQCPHTPELHHPFGPVWVELRTSASAPGTRVTGMREGAGAAQKPQRWNFPLTAGASAMAGKRDETQSCSGFSLSGGRPLKRSSFEFGEVQCVCFPFGCLCCRYLSKMQASEVHLSPFSEVLWFCSRLGLPSRWVDVCVWNETMGYSFALLPQVVPTPLAEKTIFPFSMALALLLKVS